MLMTPRPAHATPNPVQPASGAAAGQGAVTRLSITTAAGAVTAFCIGAIADELRGLFAPGLNASTVDTLRGGASAKTVAATDRQQRRYDPRPYTAALAETYPGYPDRARPVLRDALIRGSTPLLLAALLPHLDSLDALLKGLSPGAIARLVYLLELAIADPDFARFWAAR
jgi:hypothetical protein